VRRRRDLPDHFIEGLLITLACGAGLGLALEVSAEPTVPGFEVDVYAEVPGASSLAFAPDGVLFVGTEQTGHRIYRVGIGGAPITEFGDAPFQYPHGVLYDAAGGVSGAPGSVIVYGAHWESGGQAHVSAIAPDGSTKHLFFGPPLVAPESAAIDRYGRMFIGDFPGLWVTTGDELELFTPRGFGYIDSANFLALDGAGQILFSHEVGPDWDALSIRLITEQGELDETPFVWQRPGPYMHGLAFSPKNRLWQGDLVAVSGNRWQESSTIYRIDDEGHVLPFGHDFPPGTLAPTFGPDSTLYLCNPDAGLIYRVTPNVDATVRARPYHWREVGVIDVSTTDPMTVYVFSTESFDATQIDFDTVEIEGFEDDAKGWPWTIDVGKDGVMDYQVTWWLYRQPPLPCGYQEHAFSAMTEDGRQVRGLLKFEAVGCTP
jgi:hypothetical protein